MTPQKKMPKTGTLTVNGQRLTADAANLAALLVHLGVGVEAVVVELNGTIIPSEDFAATPVADGDNVEIVRFVGGG